MSTAFPDIAPFPGHPTPSMGHNKPPLDEQIVSEFIELLREDNILSRIESLTAKGASPADCESNDTAGRYADYVKMCKEVEKHIQAARVRINRPLLEAQRALNGKAENLTDPMIQSSNRVQSKLEVYVADQRVEAQRVADEAAKKAREEAEAARAAAEVAGVDPDLIPVVTVQPVKVEAPVVRGDYGAKLVTRSNWKGEVINVRQLPDAVLKNEKVIEAINKLLSNMARSGTRDVKGARIWNDESNIIR